jgi:acyl carrier protein
MREDISAESVEIWLGSWFVAKGKLSSRISPSAETDYFEAGWLTSMEVVEFVSEIEEHFAMQFTDQDLQDARFVTIAGLAELILERSPQERLTQSTEIR